MIEAPYETPSFMKVWSVTCVVPQRLHNMMLLRGADCREERHANVSVVPLLGHWSGLKRVGEERKGEERRM